MEKCASKGIGSELANLLYDRLEQKGMIATPFEQMQKKASNIAFETGVEDGAKWTQKNLDLFKQMLG